MKPWERVAERLRSNQPDIKNNQEHAKWRSFVWNSWHVLKMAFPRLSKDSFLDRVGYWG